MSVDIDELVSNLSVQNFRPIRGRLYEALAELRQLRAWLEAVTALCSAADEASLHSADPDFEPIEVPWTVAIRAILTSSHDPA